MIGAHRILVVSNNAFSKTRNNGKTLASFFTTYPKVNIAQLYFNGEYPSDVNYQNYYRMSDKDMLQRLFKCEEPGGVVQPISELTGVSIDPNKKKKRKMSGSFKGETARLLREVIWLGKSWKTKNLLEWLEDFSPTVVFLCAGDSLFAYNIAEDIRKNFCSKLVVYITDDYILPRKTLSLSWWLRRNLLLHKMKRAITDSDLFITISEEMQSVYRKIFGKNSIVAMNIPPTMQLSREEDIREKGQLNFIYAGGLQFERYQSLRLIGLALKKYNSNKSRRKGYLHIYSGGNPSKEVINLLNIEGASSFNGSLNSDQLRQELNNSDILVHVESFSPKAIESTRLSVSTKIAEYLSLAKPILAVGPPQVASMKYLSDCAHTLTEVAQIEEGIKEIIESQELRTELAVKSEKKYFKYYNPNLVIEHIDVI